jgi:hypothetical protein
VQVHSPAFWSSIWSAVRALQPTTNSGTRAQASHVSKAHMTADRQLDDRRGLPYFGLRAPMTRRHSPESGFQPEASAGSSRNSADLRVGRCFEPSPNRPCCNRSRPPQSRRSRIPVGHCSGTRVTCSWCACRGLLWRARVRVGRVRVGIGQRGGLATERNRTRLTVRVEWLGRVGGGVGAPSVTSVLDDADVVGDNNRVWVSPLEGARSHHCSEAVQHECWRAARLGS